MSNSRTSLPKNLLTIYGRKPVLEALRNDRIDVFRLHLANSNQKSAMLNDLVNFANRRQIEIRYHDRDQLSRISKNKKQDQGVAADILCPQFFEFNDFLEAANDATFSLMAIDRVTNPQNLGMIIRSVCASPMDGLLMPLRGCAKLDSLVIKASAGTLFNAKIIFAEDLEKAVSIAKNRGIAIYGLSSHNSINVSELKEQLPNIFLLGNETEGVKPELLQQCDEVIHIPMRNNVESLNVAVTAGLIAFRSSLGMH